jgi:hypothetical protein
MRSFHLVPPLPLYLQVTKKAPQQYQPAGEAGTSWAQPMAWQAAAGGDAPAVAEAGNSWAQPMAGQAAAGGDGPTAAEGAASEGQAQAAAPPAAGGQPMVGEAAASGVQADALAGEAAAPPAAGGQPMVGEAAASGVQADALAGEAAAPPGMEWKAAAAGQGVQAAGGGAAGQGAAAGVNGAAGSGVPGMRQQRRGEDMAGGGSEQVSSRCPAWGPSCCSPAAGNARCSAVSCRERASATGFCLLPALPLPYLTPAAGLHCAVQGSPTPPTSSGPAGGAGCKRRAGKGHQQYQHLSPSPSPQPHELLSYCRAMAKGTLPDACFAARAFPPLCRGRPSAGGGRGRTGQGACQAAQGSRGECPGPGPAVLVQGLCGAAITRPVPDLACDLSTLCPPSPLPAGGKEGPSAVPTDG